MGRYLEPVAALRTPKITPCQILHERAVLRGMGDGPKRPPLGIFQGLPDAHVVDSSTTDEDGLAANVSERMRIPWFSLTQCRKFVATLICEGSRAIRG